jgi:hypothetical protein
MRKKVTLAMLTTRRRESGDDDDDDECEEIIDELSNGFEFKALRTIDGDCDIGAAAAAAGGVDRSTKTTALGSVCSRSSAESCGFALPFSSSLSASGVVADDRSSTVEPKRRMQQQQLKRCCWKRNVKMRKKNGPG